MLNIVTVLQRTQQYFSDQGIASPRLDAELLLGHVLKLDRMALYLKFDQPINSVEHQTRPKQNAENLLLKLVLFEQASFSEPSLVQVFSCASFVKMVIFLVPYLDLLY